MNNRKKQQGITLIALAVTIIVMLILAGVTIAALTSENGIVNQATKVKERNEIAKVEEEAKLEYSNLILEKQMEGHGEIIELSDVIERLEEKGYETAEKDGKDYIKIGDYYYEIKIGDGQIRASNIAKNPDKKEFYGEKVINYTCPNTAGVGTWRIFYADTENIYLIADDYINIDNMPKKEKIVDNDSSGNHSRLSMQNVLGDYAGGAATIDSTFAIKWLSSYWKNNSTSKNLNVQALAYMIDTSIWNTLYKGDYAKYAIGGPTIEMYVKSWNDIHSEEKKIECEAESNLNGYKIKFADSVLYNTDINGLAQDEFNSIYIKSDSRKAPAMWIASPSATNPNFLMFALCSGTLAYNSYSGDYIGFRPIVCLNSNVNLKKVDDGYEIIELKENQISIAKEKTEGIVGAEEIAGKKYDEDTKVTIKRKEILIPAGATVSKIPGEYENVDEGIVIYIINDDKANWDDKEYMQKTYDQFVWVPVDRNNVVLDLSSNYSSLNENQIKSEVQKQINKGKYPMAIKTGTQTENKDDYIGVMYRFTEETNEVVVEPYSGWTPKSTKEREPSVINDSNYDNNTSNLQQINGILGTSYANVTSFGTALQSQYNKMVEKVKNAGGFWVGRYETSSMSDSTTRAQVASKKGTTSGISSVTWYRMYAQQSLYSELVLKSVNPKTTQISSMIWGSQYDQIMIWMKGEPSSDQAKSRGKYYVTNGAGKGNYGTINGVTNDNYSGIAPTGSQEAYSVKKIFDLAGNVCEWTLVAVDYADVRIRFGGYYKDTTTDYISPVNRNGYPPTLSDPYNGSRLVLY